MLVARGLRRCFGNRVVVRHLDLVVERGDRVALHGPNGSGKTTVLRCTAGTVSPTDGHIAVCGKPAGSMAARRLTGLSLSQERAFYLRLTARANLHFFARVRGHGQRAATRLVAALEEELELSDILDERANRCSTGMLQQVAFARALLDDPPLLLLDEPTRSLDADAVERLWAALDRRADTAVLIATHVDHDLDRCERVIELPT